MSNLPTIIGQSIDVLSNKFGTQGVELWKMLVWGKQVTSVGGLLAGVVLLLVGIWSARKVDFYEEETVPYFAVAIGGILIGSIFAAVSFTGAIAPEYALIMELIGK